MSTRLDVTTCRAQIVHDALLATPEVERVEDISRLFPRWRPDILGAAIDVLVSTGRITEAADGRLCVHPWRRAAA